MNGNLEMLCWWCGTEVPSDQIHWHLERPYHFNCRLDEIQLQARRKRKLKLARR